MALLQKYGSALWRQSLNLQFRPCVPVTDKRFPPLGGAKDKGSELNVSQKKKKKILFPYTPCISMSI